METIGIKQLHKELKRITLSVQHGKSFKVMKNGRPVFKIEPLDHQPKKKYTLKDFERIRFSSGDGTLSQNIDKIVYGVD